MDFWGFEIFNSGIFLGRKIWQVFCWLDLSGEFFFLGGGGCSEQSDALGIVLLSIFAPI